jgi:hypothetical protein
MTSIGLSHREFWNLPDNRVATSDPAECMTLLVDRGWSVLVSNSILGVTASARKGVTSHAERKASADTASEAIVALARMCNVAKLGDEPEPTNTDVAAECFRKIIAAASVDPCACEVDGLQLSAIIEPARNGLRALGVGR